jgi:hypothetical protein
MMDAADEPNGLQMHSIFALKTPANRSMMVKRKASQPWTKTPKPGRLEIASMQSRPKQIQTR